MREIQGMNALQLRLGNISKNAQKVVGDILEANANEIATNAISKAPTMFKTKNGKGFPTNGEIVQSIRSEKVAPLKNKVSVNSVMAAYAEFGTGAYVDIPQGWEDVAWSYYKNGKGLILPTPYFIPAVRKGKEQTIKDIQNYLSNL